ncbi:MAG: hypothetical protein LQ340_004132 [Diploschistes diacapsis]|nr:MAG: hypothetical protein LQ340_004132 [Diploschistes diacapsis]
MKDAGYLAETRRPIYRISSDNGAFNFVKKQHQSTATTQSSVLHAEAPRLHQSSSAQDPAPIIEESGCASEQSSIHYSRKGLSPNHLSRPSSRYHLPQHLTRPTSRQADSTTGRPTGISRAVTIHSAPDAKDLYALHQRAKAIMTALENTDACASSDATSPPVPNIATWSNFGSQTSLFQTTFSGRTAVPLTRRASASSSDSVRTPLFSPAETIDWTDPTTRRRTYEKHDRNARGLRGVVKKITPRWLRGNVVEFYGGGSDIGSVRRYRLDVEQDTGAMARDVDGASEKRADWSKARKEDQCGRAKTSKSKSTWSCFSGHSRLSQRQLRGS